MNYQKGIGLTEILIGLLLSSMIMVSLINQFLAVKKNYKYVSHLMDDDIELQMVTDLIRDSIQRAGFTPCLNLNMLDTASSNNKNIKLASIDEKMVDNNVFKSQRMSENFDVVESFINQNELVTAGQILKKGQTILIADCFHAEVQQIAQVRRYNGKLIVALAKPLFFKYHTPAYVGQWLQEQFYIKHHQGTSSLFYKTNHAEELSSQIKSMSLSVYNKRAHEVVNVTLGLNNDKQTTISAFMRP
jgi:hypothetical protein